MNEEAESNIRYVDWLDEFSTIHDESGAHEENLKKIVVSKGNYYAKETPQELIEVVAELFKAISDNGNTYAPMACLCDAKQAELDALRAANPSPIERADAERDFSACLRNEDVIAVPDTIDEYEKARAHLEAFYYYVEECVENKDFNLLNEYPWMATVFGEIKEEIFDDYSDLWSDYRDLIRQSLPRGDREKATYNHRQRSGQISQGGWDALKACFKADFCGIGTGNQNYADERLKAVLQGYKERDLTTGKTWAHIALVLFESGALKKVYNTFAKWHKRMCDCLGVKYTEYKPAALKLDTDGIEEAERALWWLENYRGYQGRKN